jgi:transposase-like protein
MVREYRRRRSSGNYNQNDGVPGVVYILRNDAFKETWLKIGCSRHSGHVRARDMNREASTGLPAHHVCVFEVKTLDCGRAEKNVHSALSQYRKGRQEFFEVDIETAKSAIVFCCSQIDQSIRSAEAKALEERQRIEQNRRQEERNLAQARLAEEAQRQAEVIELDLSCPACNTGLVAKIPRDQLDTKHIRCPKCSEIFSVSRGMQAKSERAAKPESNEARQYREDLDRQPFLPPKKSSEWSKLDIGIAVMVGALVIGVIAERTNSSKPVQARPSSFEPAPLSEQKLEQGTLAPPRLAHTSSPVAAPVKNSPQPIRPSATAVPEPRVIADAREVRQAIDRAYQRYPYLQSPDGVEAMHSIRARANFLIEERHVSIADAYDQAVRGIAPRFEPLWYRDAPLSSTEPAQ